MNPPGNAFIFAPHFNHIGNDAHGAFHPGMEIFARFCNDNNEDSASTLKFNNKASDRVIFDEILHRLAVAPPQLDAIVYFGHGLRDLMVSAKIGMGFMDEFAASIRANSGMGVTVILYACLCGAPGGFAEQLAAKLADLSATVYAHAVSGHSFQNPTVRRFPGGTHVCPPDMVSAWIRAMHDPNPKSDFWARSLFMTDNEIRAELAAT